MEISKRQIHDLLIVISRFYQLHTDVYFVKRSITEKGIEVLERCRRKGMAITKGIHFDESESSYSVKNKKLIRVQHGRFP
jgi:hypothetical protein